jgi:hypothetical protein
MYMTIAANLKPTGTGFDVSDTKQNLKPSPGTPQALSQSDRSFGERWQSLVDLDKTAADKQVAAREGDVNQSPSDVILDLREGYGTAFCANNSGKSESNLRVRHQPTEGSRHRTPSTNQQASIGTIETNPAGTPLVPIIQWHVAVPEHRTMNANQASGIETVPPIGARRLQVENLTEVHAMRRATRDSRSMAAPPTAQMALDTTDVTSQPDFAAQGASEAGGNGETVESAQRLTGPSVVGHAITIGTPGADDPARNAGPSQVRPTATTDNLAASKQETDIRNSTQIATRLAPIQSKGIASSSPSTPSAPLRSAHFATNQAPHILLSNSGQSSQQQPDASFLHVSPVQSAPNREAGTTLLSQTFSSPESSTTVHQTFAALDAEHGAAISKWVHAGKNTAEAGFEDPVLGWVGVRAQAGPSGGVHATVVPISADAAQSLGAHLSGLSSYLSEHRTSVETVTMSAPDNNSGQHSMGQRGGNPSRHESDQNGIPHSAGNTDSARPQSAVAMESNGTTVGAQLTARGGIYVSVLA